MNICPPTLAEVNARLSKLEDDIAQAPPITNTSLAFVEEATVEVGTIVQLANQVATGALSTSAIAEDTDPEVLLRRVKGLALRLQVCNEWTSEAVKKCRSLRETQSLTTQSPLAKSFKLIEEKLFKVEKDIGAAGPITLNSASLILQVAREIGAILPLLKQAADKIVQCRLDPMNLSKTARELAQRLENCNQWMVKSFETLDQLATEAKQNFFSLKR